METFPNTTVNTADEILFIGGDYRVLIFEIYDIDNQPIDLTGMNCTWEMCRYGQENYSVLSKVGVVSASPVNEFTVTLTTDDTKYLYGKFEHQPVITTTSGSSLITVEHRPIQGLITIAPRIKTI